METSAQYQRRPNDWHAIVFDADRFEEIIDAGVVKLGMAHSITISVVMLLRNSLCHAFLQIMPMLG